jgi:uncharacterized protein YcbK (DUF882 family)
MTCPTHDGASLLRRRLLCGTGAALVLGCTAAPLRALAGAPDSAPALTVQPLSREEALDWKKVLLAGERSIRMRRDGPPVVVRYCDREGRLDREGYRAACYLLRDVREGCMVQIDPQLLDVLCGIQRWMEFNGKSSTIEITSGYRTVKTNDSAEGSGRHSMHLVGKAADIVVPGAPSTMIGAMVQRFNNEGGTGIYLGRGFVHVDTGSARSWVTPAPAPAPAPRRRVVGTAGRRHRR